MNFEDADGALYDEIVSFGREELGAEEGVAPGRRRWRRCGERGLLGLCLPERFGGRGLQAASTARALEALGYAHRDMGLTFALSAHLFACALPIALDGGAALQAEVLPGLASGALVGAHAITESDAGSDVFALRTTARREGSVYVLDGVKSFVTNGPVADVCLVYAKTDPQAGPLGISAFAVAAETPGLRRGEAYAKMGLDSAPVGALHLEGCRVPEARRLGAEGAGAAIFKRSMMWERTCLFAGYLGMMERQLETAVAYATSRRQFRKAIAKFQAVSHKIAGMKLRLESARLLLYRACWRLDRGDSAMLDVALAKLAVSEAVVQSGLDLLQLHGGLGYTVDLGLEQELRDALPATIFSGTSEIQRDLIAAELGL
jgi:alkylation response protein AidB-like acyl-CoA dehydrogenase